MKVRFISGVLVALIMLVLVWLGDIVLAVSLCGISIIAFLEMTGATGVRGTSKKINLIEGVGILAIVIYYALVYFIGNSLYNMLVIVFALIALMVVFVFTFPKYKAEQIMNSYFALIYAPVLLSFTLMTRMISNRFDTPTTNIGFFAVWMIFIAAWASDTCAYFVGVLLGKHKITPNLSPKKTVEGCLGGVAGASLAGYLYGLILVNNQIIAMDMVWVFTILGMCGSVVAQIGDLAASAIKRNYNVKNYGKCIPGHGGILDRFDSVIFTSPLIFFLAVIFLK